MKKAAVVLLSLLFAPHVMAQSTDWQKTWDETLAAAKKEGKVVIMGSPDPVMRKEIIPAFEKRYGITLEYIAGQSGPLAERVKMERSSGIYSVDVFMSGIGTTFYSLLPEKILDPIKPLMLLPEVTDNSKWKLGKPSYIDPDGDKIMMLFRSVDSIIFINAAEVKPEEMTAATDLLNPKWKGKIAAQDPLGSGSGGDTGVNFYRQMGPDFVKQLYIDQKVVKSQDRRQLIDWVARGSNPICLTCKIETATDLLKEGFKLQEVFFLKGMKNRVTSSPFVMSVANKAPHPAAMRVFANWMAGQEALQIYSRANLTATLRTDEDESFLDPQIIPKKGVEYVEATDPEWIGEGRKDMANKMRELLKSSK
jgi:ABC-type Fe3+ transport system substrate-binding protein